MPGLSVYASNKRILLENIGRRLENFFWRIWSSDRVRKRLSGTQVNILFDIINQGGYIRTTPTASPKSSKSLNAYFREVHQQMPPAPPSAARLSEAGSPSRQGHAGQREVLTPANSSVKEIAKDVGGSSRQGRVGDVVESQSKPFLPTHGKKSPDIKEAESNVNLESNSITPTPTSPLAVMGQFDDASKANRRSEARTRPSPILKKEASSGSSRSSKSARVLFPSEGPHVSGVFEPEGASLSREVNLDSPLKPNTSRRQASTRFNEEVAVSIPKASSSVTWTSAERSAKSSAESGQKPSKRNPVIVANTAATKTRPAFMRQRSVAGGPRDIPLRSSSYQNLPKGMKTPPMSRSAESQSGLSFGESQAPASKKNIRAASSDTQSQPRQPSTGVSAPRTAPMKTYPLPIEADNQQESRRVSSHGKDTSAELSDKPKRLTPPLIEPNFRARFLDRKRPSQQSFADLSTLPRKSSAAIPTSASYQATGMMEAGHSTLTAGKTHGREAFTNVTAPLKAPAPEGPDAEEEITAAPLSRTKSQLSLLLEKEKARAAGRGGSSK